MSDAAGEAVNLPTQNELLDTLKESIQEIFTSMIIRFSEAAVHKHADESEDSPSGSAGEAGHPEILKIEYESIVDFEGLLDGSVVLRCSAQGAQDIARGLLMLEEGDTLELEEICDALGECTNMISGLLKTKALDPISEFSISTPRSTGPMPEEVSHQRCGTLAYKLTKGLITAEVWLDSKE